MSATNYTTSTRQASTAQRDSLAGDKNPEGILSPHARVRAPALRASAAEQVGGMLAILNVAEGAGFDVKRARKLLLSTFDGEFDVVEVRSELLMIAQSLKDCGRLFTEQELEDAVKRIFEVKD